MHTLINQYIGCIIEAISLESHVQPYISLVQALHVKPATDAGFQRDFCRYWRLNAARLSPEFIRAYFAHLQELKDQQNISVEAVARHLLKVPTNANGHSLQFSFATKLVHMLRLDQPIFTVRV